MPDQTDWLMAPVLERLCSYESLRNGAVTLLDIARMNDALAVRDENNRRLREASRG